MRPKVVHEQFFSSSDKLLEHLSIKQENTQWIKGQDISDLQFLMTDMGMLIEVGNNTYPLAECSKESIFERLGMEGEVLNQLPKEVLSDFMNECAKVRKGKGQVVVVDGKVDAVLSDNKTGIDYSIIPAYRVFEETQQWIWENVEHVQYFKGSYSHSYVFGKWITKDELPNLPNKYLTFSLATSDIGKSSICYRASLVNYDSKYELPICSPIKINHRTENTMNAVYTALDMLREEAIQARDFKKLVNQHINHPKNCLLRIAKKLKLPKKAVYATIEHFPEIENVMNALDVYLIMGNIITYYRTKGMVNTERLIGDIYKAVGLDWTDFDLDGYFIY